MAEQEWTLVEYRPGRFVKVSPEGEVLGRATEAEARAWFARRGWPLVGMRERRTGQPPAPAGRKLTEWEPPTATVEVAPREEPDRPTAAADRREAPPGPEVAVESPVSPHLEVEEGQAVPVDAGAEELAPEVARPEEPAPQVAGPDEQGQRVAEPEAPEAAALETEPDMAVATPAAPEATAPPPGPGDDLLEQPLRPGGPPEEAAAAVEERWLWLDPRGDPRRSTESFDINAFLRQASSSFRAKDWAGGREPGRLAAHPDSVTASLEAAASELGLEIVADPRVMPGTYMLGLAQPGEA